MVPNWLRVVLIILTFLSFVPQIQRIFTRKDGFGISLYYTLFNVVSATEQLTLSFFYVVTIKDSDFFTHKPHNAGDWLNFIQFSLVWILSMILSKIVVAAIYFAFLLISIVPLFIDAVNHAGLAGQEDDYRKWGIAFFFGIHDFYINPVVTLLSITALFSQAREIRANPSPPQALSLIGLAAQAVVFAIVALSWIWRVVFPSGIWEHMSFHAFITWYQLVGWAAVDNAVFAIVQAILLMLASRHTHRHPSSSLGTESQPLLHSDG